MFKTEDIPGLIYASTSWIKDILDRLTPTDSQLPASEHATLASRGAYFPSRGSSAWPPQLEIQYRTYKRLLRGLCARKRDQSSSSTSSRESTPLMIVDTYATQQGSQASGSLSANAVRDRSFDSLSSDRFLAENRRPLQHALSRPVEFLARDRPSSNVTGP